MPTEEPEAKLSTLNPLFLQAVRDEAAKKQKAGQADWPVVNPVSAFASGQTEGQPDAVELSQAPPPIIVIDEPAIAEKDSKQEPTSHLATAKAAIAGIRAEIDQAQQQLDRLIKIKAVVEPARSATGKASLNELKMQKLAIQMALVADSKEYGDQDLLAVDKQIAELTGAGNRQPEVPANTVENMKLNAEIGELQDKVRVLTEELNRQIGDYNLSVAFKKAGDYLQTLQAACVIRHELLALVELLAYDGLLMDLNLGGELPIPSGFELFDSMPQDALATTIEAIEDAKVRICQEILI